MHGCPPKHVEMGKFAPSLGSTDNPSVCSNALLSTGDDWWRPQMAWGRCAEESRDCEYEDTQQQICKIYAINKYTTPDGIKDK